MEDQDIDAMFELIDITHEKYITRAQLVKCLENIKARSEDIEKAKKMLHNKIEKKMFKEIMTEALNSLKATPYV